MNDLRDQMTTVSEFSAETSRVAGAMAHAIRSAKRPLVRELPTIAGQSPTLIVERAGAGLRVSVTGLFGDYTRWTGDHTSAHLSSLSVAMVRRQIEHEAMRRFSAELEKNPGAGPG